MKNIISFIYLSLIGCNIYSQQINPQVVCTSGATMNQSNAKLSFTVGEITVKTITGGGNSIGQGFTNSSATISVTSIQEPEVSEMKVTVYPNPTSSLVFIDIADGQIPSLLIEIVDFNGKLVNHETYITGNNHIGINTQDWAAGNYMIRLSDKKSRTIGSYKLIKIK